MHVIQSIRDFHLQLNKIGGASGFIDKSKQIQRNNRIVRI